MVDACLQDGSRVNAIIPPLAIDGPILSIRRFAADPYEMEDLISFNSLTPGIGEILKGIIKSRLNVLISGGTGSGKTTLLNVLSRFIPATERIITIEDASELQLKQEHVIRLETRPPNIEGRGEVTQRDLVRNSLRMRPDRIIVGEVRGQEAFDMLQAMNTGGALGLSKWNRQTYIIADDFHTYAIEWEADQVRWYYDGNHYFTVNRADVGDREWVFNQPFFIILNLAGGGQLPGMVGLDTVFPAQLYVDYVRVYQR